MPTETEDERLKRHEQWVKKMRRETTIDCLCLGLFTFSCFFFAVVLGTAPR